MKLSAKTILLVEDEALIGMAEKNCLTEEGFNVIQILSGEEAIETVEMNPDSIDLILMDIDLGLGMDGTEAAEAILKIKDIPIIFLSSHTEKEVVDKTEKITSYGYVVKDTGITVLLASIKMAFRLYEAKKEILAKKAEMYRQEETLRYSLNLLKNYVKHAKNAIAIFDRNMNYLYYSDQYIKDYNLEWRDLTGLSHYDVFPEIPYRWKTIHRAALKGEVLSASEDVFPRANGKIDWVNWECSPWYETDGTIGGIILNSEVVTGHVNAVHKMKKYSAAFNSARWGIIVISGDLKKIDLANNEFARMHGYTVEEILKLSPEEFMLPEETQRHKGIAGNSQAGGLMGFETLHVRKDKTSFPVQVDSTVIKDEKGNILYHAVNVMDIAERKKWQL